jgi:xanthine/uracil permease
MQIIAGEHLNRRNRFIIACSLGVGIGVTVYPQWASWGPFPYGLWPCVGCSSGVKSLRDAIILILSSGLT